jgi:hypothetical protein
MPPRSARNRVGRPTTPVRRGRPRKTISQAAPTELNTNHHEPISSQVTATDLNTISQDTNLNRKLTII